MALATCTAAGLVEAGSCFTSPTFTSHQRKAMMVYLLNNFAASIGAEVGSSFSDLYAGASCFSSLTVDQRESAIVGVLNGGFPINFAFANTVGSMETLTRSQMVDAINCLENYSDEQLDLMLLRLFCMIWGAQQSLE